MLHYPQDAKKYMNKKGTKPLKLMMDDEELYDLWHHHKKGAVEIKAACTGSLGMLSQLLFHHNPIT